THGLGNTHYPGYSTHYEQTGWSVPHFVLIIGYDSTGVWLNDSGISAGRGYHITYAQLTHAIADLGEHHPALNNGNTLLLIAPQGERENESPLTPTHSPRGRGRTSHRGRGRTRSAILAAVSDTAQAAEQLGRRAVTNSVLILAARTVSRVISLVVVIVLANALGDANYGRYTTLIAYSGLVAVVGDLGFQPLYTREAARHRADLGRYPGPW